LCRVQKVGRRWYAPYSYIPKKVHHIIESNLIGMEGYAKMDESIKTFLLYVTLAKKYCLSMANAVYENRKNPVQKKAGRSMADYNFNIIFSYSI
jgi:hypothetical protein